MLVLKLWSTFSTSTFATEFFPHKITEQRLLCPSLPSPCTSSLWYSRFARMNHHTDVVKKKTLVAIADAYSTSVSTTSKCCSFFPLASINLLQWSCRHSRPYFLVVHLDSLFTGPSAPVMAKSTFLAENWSHHRRWWLAHHAWFLRQPEVCTNTEYCLAVSHDIPNTSPDDIH
jgi:hypothetical protein